jgi:hypothetical protein
MNIRILNVVQLSENLKWQSMIHQDIIGFAIKSFKSREEIPGQVKRLQNVFRTFM